MIQPMAAQVRRHNKTISNVKSVDGDSKGIWSALLDSVSAGKRLAEKNLLILGRYDLRLPTVSG